MKNIVVLNTKGGCGKTTIATHLAVYASTLGLDVALADHDEQQSATDWIKSRPKRCADIRSIAMFEGESIDKPYEVVIHDMPAGMVGAKNDVLFNCNKLIIPITPSPVDIKAALRFWMMLSNTGLLDSETIDIGIVENRVKPNTKYLKSLDAFIERIGIPKIATLRDTQNYIRSMDAGLTLFDLPPNRVAKDIIQWEPLMEWTGFFDIDDDELATLLGAEVSPQGDTSVSTSSFGEAQSSDSLPTDDRFVSLDDMNFDQIREESEFENEVEADY